MQYMKINFLELNVPLYNAQIQLLCFLFPQFYGSQLNGIIIIINVIIIINITIKFFIIIIMIILPRLCSSLTDWSSNRLQGSHTILQELRLLPLSRIYFMNS